MKNKILLLLAVIGAGFTFVLTGCSEDDTDPPIIILNGASSIELSLNSGTWTDLGATATDEEDGSTTVTSNASSTNPNTNLVGTYTITYTSVDAEGNVGTATRTIRVKNDAEDFAGTYSVHDTVPGEAFNYMQTISVSTTQNNRVVFSLFGNYANNTSIYANKLGNGDLEIPGQTAADIGSGTGCDISTHAFSSSSFTTTVDGFILVYNDAVTAPSACIASTIGTATYTKQ